MNLNAAGLTATRTIKALGVGAGDLMESQAYAAGQRWGDTPAVQRFFAAAVDPVETGDTPGLVPNPDEVGYDLFLLARPLSIMGRVPGLRRAPWGTRLITQTVLAGNGAWLGQGKPFPITSASLTGETLPPRKVGLGLVVTVEVVRRSDPAAETLLSAEIARGVASVLDVSFIDPANTGTADVEPASITSGATPIASSGATLAAIDTDLGAMIAEMIAAGSTLEFGAWVMRPETAIHLSRLRGSGGTPAFPLVTARGGTLYGMPVIVSANLPAGFLVLLDGSRIVAGPDGSAELSSSKQASVQLSDTPADGAQPMVSLWQNNLVGLRALLFANWLERGGQAAAVLDGVTY